MRDETFKPFVFSEYIEEIRQRETEYWTVLTRGSELDIIKYGIQALTGWEIKKTIQPGGASLEDKLRYENRDASISIHLERDRDIQRLQEAIRDGMVSHSDIPPRSDRNRNTVVELFRAAKLQNKLDNFVQICIDNGAVNQAHAEDMKETFERSHLYHHAVDQLIIHLKGLSEEEKTRLELKLQRKFSDAALENAIRDEITLYIEQRNRSTPSANENLKISDENFGYYSLDTATIPDKISDAHEALWYLTNLATYFYPDANPYKRLLNLAEDTGINPLDLAFEVQIGNETKKRTLGELLDSTTDIAYKYGKKLLDVINSSPIRDTIYSWFDSTTFSNLSESGIHGHEREFANMIYKCPQRIKTPNWVIHATHLNPETDEPIDEFTTQPMFPGVVRGRPTNNPNKTVRLN